MLVNWDSIGITGESNFLQLFYNKHSETLRVHFYRAIGNGYGIRSLWSRRVSDRAYLRLTPLDDYLSYEDPVLCPSSPHVFTNVMRVGKKEGGFDGYEWDSIRRIDLRTGQADVVAVSGGEGIGADNESLRLYRRASLVTEG